MKKKIIITITIFVLVFTALNMIHANANEVARITSQPGISQVQWEATSQYQSFICPEGTSRGIGVDMNFTSDSSDDTWFVTCNLIQTNVFRPITQPITQPIDTTTVGVVVVDTNIATPAMTQAFQTTETSTQTTTSVVIDSNNDSKPTQKLVVDSNTATSAATSVDTSTVMVQQSSNLETNPTAVAALSNVVWVLKNQILLIQKMYAKILIRAKGKK